MKHDKRKIVYSFTNKDPKIKTQGYIIQTILALIVIAVILLFFLETAKTFNLNQLMQLLIFSIILLISNVLLHEIFHLFPLWFYSKAMPLYRITRVLLREEKEVSKKEGLISYLLPFFVLSIGYTIGSFFVEPALQIALRMFALIHIPMCGWDFLFSFILYKTPGDNLRLAHIEHGNIVETIIFHY